MICVYSYIYILCVFCLCLQFKNTSTVSYLGDDSLLTVLLWFWHPPKWRSFLLGWQDPLTGDLSRLFQVSLCFINKKIYGGFLKWRYPKTMGFPTKKNWGVLGIPPFKGNTRMYNYWPVVLSENSLSSDSVRCVGSRLKPHRFLRPLLLHLLLPLKPDANGRKLR